MQEVIQLLSQMQENHNPLENSQTRLRQDILNNSFSDLEDHDEDNFEEQATRIDISEVKTNSCETLIKQELDQTVHVDIKSEVFPLSIRQLQRNNDQLHNLSESVLKKDQQFVQKKNQETTGKPKDNIQAQHIQKIRMIYSRSFLGSQKLSLSQIKKLKSYLFIPKHGEELVRWGNQKFGTQHTVVSALQRLQYLQDSQCSDLTVKLKQNLKYLLLLCLCLVAIKVFV